MSVTNDRSLCKLASGMSLCFPLSLAVQGPFLLSNVLRNRTTQPASGRIICSMANLTSQLARRSLTTSPTRLPLVPFNRLAGCGRGVRDAASLGERVARSDGRRLTWPMSGARTERASVRRPARRCQLSTKKYQIRPS
ncbi:jg27165 [Pararge aegeria aegeria]|uniref:Jg27165 protein n=1 Tax=Pararge aegeria aegeria TaxID=348720 RepID=A0A8S4SNI4_9NEOP|nr:jg27165 [Pararge aegeria aegeria]